MKAFVVLSIALAIGLAECGVVPATTFVRAPSFDSAVVKSDRVGGSFAYSTVEGHAYAAVSPVVERITAPVAVSYTPHQVHLGHINTPVAVTQPIYAEHSVVSQPIYSHQHIFANPPVFAQNPVFGGFPSYPAIGGFPTSPVGGIASGPGVGGIASIPGVGGIASAPAAPANPAPTPVQGTVIDDDTVAVDSA
ncbi:uncharacterized protein LOC103312348 [Tribolium castaneum]|uniref:Pupal cuticle protein C1B-like Protein n=1 Tax=Tribolium castaneum TaxID=7070 RepID=D6WHG6_TRICA|nr:PREDICTED: uncharacterized protein LOC103312348 [Tribolium castaneum]EFA00092.1 hypothetical protein TcasGA2_TC002907 [Tribolium castaneum]|eukprot:XP_008191008.1 PREDICTED: uncharacterized protein LOC103312348 [Tribolium castaneum]